QVLTLCERRQVPTALQFLVDDREALPGNEDVDILREAAESMPEERHSTDDGIGGPEGFEATSDVVQGLEDRAILIKVSAAFAHCPPPITVQHLLVYRTSNHRGSIGV